MTSKYVIEHLNDWDPKKKDPTFYDAESKKIFVRNDYGIDEDVYGWIVHEKVHLYLDSIHFEDNYNPPLIEYPFNEIERHAYTWQFVFLLETMRVRCLDDIKKIMPWKFERYGDEWAKKYFNLANLKMIDDDPNIPPTMIHGGGRLESNAELLLEEVFRDIVEEAKAKLRKK